MEDSTVIRVLCSKLVISQTGSSIQWLIGSPFAYPLAIVSTFRCLHTLPNSSSPDYPKELDDLRTLVLKGLHIIGALIVGNGSNVENLAGEAVNAAGKMRKLLTGYDYGREFEQQELIGAVADPDTHDIRFFVSKLSSLIAVSSVVYEDNGDKLVSDKGCLLQCQLPIRLPLYMPVNRMSDAEQIFLRANEAVVSKLKDPQVTFVFESNEDSTEAPRPVIVRGSEYNCDTTNKLLSEADQASNKMLLCSYFSSRNKSISSLTFVENADVIQVCLFLNKSENSPKPSAPAAEYVPAMEETSLSIVDYKLEVICYAKKDLPLVYAVSKLIIPALVDQLDRMKEAMLPNLLMQTQLHPYHFCPPGMLHPVTVIYELGYGETEMKQVEVRRGLHLRLGLPLDRPLLRIANSLSFAKDKIRSSSVQKGSYLLKDVHVGIPKSGVSGGIVSLVQGSYEYYHYLQESFDDSGWGCAYRSLQTIISWFRLQHYTSVDVPSHREIQQSLVDIGDKDPSFVGSREWIGAIELSFVLDKLLGVSCKVINVRSGAELPEKCRELALHFENQGTPIMIGGGVLAYTLLGIDYNEASGDCAFLILDPHYTGNEEKKKIVNGGWCGWKKAVDNKGRNFFLHDKFYNLLLPQRPNMV